ncbi:MAG TPA: hypothetical protein VN671_01440 [Solirubrobacterales bacterium]|nr:hypothetical protein [Solirubrobacterales bacterium]
MTVKVVYLLAATTIALLAAGCGGGSSGSADACALTVLDVEGRIDPGSSGLTCDGVKQVIGGAVPATPGGYLIQAREPRATWKCHIYPSSGASPDLLACSHGAKAFAVRRMQ